jgi:hypothetical protein
MTLDEMMLWCHGKAHDARSRGDDDELDAAWEVLRLVGEVRRFREPFMRIVFEDAVKKHPELTRAQLAGVVPIGEQA